MKHASRLEVLELTGAALSDDGALVLLRHRDRFPQLRRLVCGPWGLSESAWAALRGSYPVDS